MKKVFLLFAMFGVLTFTSCGGGGEEKATEGEKTEEENNTIDH